MSGSLSTFVVRTATPADQSAVTELFAASYPHLMRGAYEEALLAAALPLMTRANPALLESGSFFVAETPEGAIIGCGGWTLQRPGTNEVESGRAHVRHFATHPNWLGRGVGRELLARCEADAETAGARIFECQASLNAVGFYEASGFHSVGRTEAPMGGGVSFPCMLMEKAIARSEG